MENENIDFLGKNSSMGAIANYLQTNGKLDPGTLRPYIKKNDPNTYCSIYIGGKRTSLDSYKEIKLTTNGTLRKDEWKALDKAVLGIAESRLGGVQDLVDNGLVYNLGNGMGTTVLQYEDISDAMEASLSMDGVTRGKGDRPKFSTHYLPIPIIHVDYEINSRFLSTSRGAGNSIDTYSAERAARKVNEKLESMLFTDTDYSFGGGDIKSYVNFADRNEVTLTTNWDDSSKAAKDILADIVSMKQSEINAKHYGPYQIYIPTAYETILDEDYDTSGQSTQTIRERILKIGNIKGIKVIDTLAANNVLMVQMTTDTVRLVRGMGITNVEWQAEGKFINKYKVMTIQVPQIRSDYNGACGITHLA